MTDLVFLDTETLGLHPEAPIWEFAAKRISGTSCEIFHFGVQHNPEHWLDDLPDPFLTDYENRYSAEISITSAAAATTISELTRDAIIVGSNPGFDLERLHKLLGSHGLEPAWHYRPIDITTMAATYLTTQGSPPGMPWNSNEISKAIGVDPDDYPRHTAMGDVEWTLAQWKVLSTATSQTSPESNEHYTKAVKLLDSTDGHNESLPFVKARIARAHVHALLAQCRP